MGVQRIHRFPVILAALVVAFSPGPPPARSQEPPPEPRPVELFFDEVEVPVVNVEVVVTDREGKPILGLTRDDFEIFEDGAAVELTNFLAVEDLGEAPVTLPAEGGERPEIEALIPREGTQDLQLIVLIDNNNIHPRSRSALFQSLRRTLRADLGETTKTMVATLGHHFEVVQPFTSEEETILAALDAQRKKLGRHAMDDLEHHRLLAQIRTAKLRDFNPGPGDGVDFIFEAAVMAAQELARDARLFAERRNAKMRETAREIKRFASSLTGIPGRKAVLYLSDGLPERPGLALMEAWSGHFDPWFQRNEQHLHDDARLEFNRVMTAQNSNEFDASAYLEDMVRHAAASRVVFYPISLPNKHSAGLGADERGSYTGSGAGSLYAASLESSSREGSLLRLAEGTGGVAFTRTHNVEALVDQVRRDFRAFYSLGYRPRRKSDRTYHSIEVQVRRPGARVRHLETQRESDPLDRLQSLTLSALFYDHRSNPLDLRLDPIEIVKTGRDRYRVTVMVEIPFQNLLLVPKDGVHQGRVSLFVGVRDRRRGTSPMSRIELPIRVPSNQIGRALISAATYPLELETNRGDKRISVGVRDRLGKVDSTANLEITVGAGEGTDAEAPPLAASR